jgi:hypothetical protein
MLPQSLATNLRMPRLRDPLRSPALVQGRASVSALSNSPNYFLCSLSSKDGELLTHLKPVELPARTILHRPEDVITHVFFPHSGVVSHVVGLTNGQFVEAGMIGRNSVVSAAAPLDGSIALSQTIVQVTVSGEVVEVGILKRLNCREQNTFHLSCTAQSNGVCSGSGAACNALHEWEERLSRRCYKHGTCLEAILCR